MTIPFNLFSSPRNARKKEILKAYRKLAQQWHPDKHEEGPAKEKASKMFMDIAAAKEVLSDPGKCPGRCDETVNVMLYFGDGTKGASFVNLM